MALLIYSKHKHKLRHLADVIQLKTSKNFLLGCLNIRHVEEHFVKNCKFRDVYFNQHSSVKCATYKNNYKIPSVL